MYQVVQSKIIILAPIYILKIKFELKEESKYFSTTSALKIIASTSKSKNNNQKLVRRHDWCSTQIQIFPICLRQNLYICRKLQLNQVIDELSAKHMQFKIHRYVSIYILYTLDRKIDTHKYLVPDRGQIWKEIKIFIYHK